MKPPKQKPKLISSFRLASLLRLQTDPKLALQLFQNPIQKSNPKSKPKSFRHSLLCYDIIISKLGRAKMFNEMEQIFLQLKTQTSFVPKEPLFCNVMTLYGRAGLPANARKVFDEMPLYRCPRTVKSYNTLLNVLMICKEFDAMRGHYVNIERHVRPDTCTFNIMIRGLCSDGNIDDALKMFDGMKRRGLVPNKMTFGTLIYGLCLNSRLKEAFKLKDRMANVHGVCPDEYVYATLCKGLCAVGEVSSAFRLKEEMERDEVKLDSAIYSTLISGLFKVGRKGEVLGVFKEMESKGCKPDTVTYNAMINGYCKDKDFKNAYRILDEMIENGSNPDAITYNVIMGELCKDGKWGEAKDLFEDMPRRGCEPDVVSYRIVFDGLSDAMQLKEAGLILDEMVFKGFKPRSSSVCKFIDRLCQRRSEDLLLPALTSLGKVSALDSLLWKMAVDVVLNGRTYCNGLQHFFAG